MQTHRNVRFHISKVTLSWYVYLKNGVLHVVKLLNIPMCFTHIHCADALYVENLTFTLKTHLFG